MFGLDKWTKTKQNKKSKHKTKTNKQANKQQTNNQKTTKNKTKKLSIWSSAALSYLGIFSTLRSLGVWANRKQKSVKKSRFDRVESHNLSEHMNNNENYSAQVSVKP